MSKISKDSKKSQSRQKTVPKKVRKNQDEITWDDIAAMSDSDDEDVGFDQAVDLNKKAQDLRHAIKKNLGGLLSSLNESEDQCEDFEEDVLDDDSTSDSGEDDDVNSSEDVVDERALQTESDKEEDGERGNTEQESLDPFTNKIVNDSLQEGNHNSDDESNMENTQSDQNLAKSSVLRNKNNKNSKALYVVASEMNSIHSKMPWAETFVIVPPTPLPFGERQDNPLDIHDDLKREVAFYNSALDAVRLARPRCEKADIPFSRPSDFFAEMVKTDDHMASVKDRLIFENKKIEAVAQRKSNKEQKLRAKESQANRLAEKAKRKREHFQKVEEWANSAAKHRGGALRDDVDAHFLNSRNNGTGPNKKRQNADRKFGFGGKRGRFKQNDHQSMNDMSGYNPRGNFAGGMKKSTNKNGSGANRSGKRARDARRAKR